MKTTQKKVNDIMWKACDSLRGIDSSQYKDYILPMLFVKYLSDAHKERVEELKTQFNGDMDRVNRRLTKEKFILDDRCTFEFIYKHKQEENIGEVIDKALERIEELNSEKLSEVFRNISFNDSAKLGNTKDRNAKLRNLIEDFNNKELDLRPSMLEGNDVIGDAYEYLIERFASDAGKKGGEFYTPSKVSELLAKLAGAKEGDSIYDPTCGSGSLLIKAAQQAGLKNVSLYGQETNGQTRALARMNMFLHNISDADIKWGDTIRNPLHKDNDEIKKFDVVVANPPFSLDKWGLEDVADVKTKTQTDIYRRFGYGLPPKSKGDYAFIQHMVASANEDGKVVVVMPHGVLFRGASEKQIRKGLIEDKRLEAVIGVPANLFFGTGIPVAILVFNKAKQNNKVLFIDASGESGFEKGKNQNKLRPQDINKIVAEYKQRKGLEKYSYEATLDEIRENDYNLNIPRYVDTFEEEEPVDIKAVTSEIKQIKQDILNTESKLNEYLKQLNLTEL